MEGTERVVIVNETRCCVVLIIGCRIHIQLCQLSRVMTFRVVDRSFGSKAIPTYCSQTHMSVLRIRSLQSEDGGKLASHNYRG